MAMPDQQQTPGQGHRGRRCFTLGRKLLFGLDAKVAVAHRAQEIKDEIALCGLEVDSIDIGVLNRSRDGSGIVLHANIRASFDTVGFAASPFGLNHEHRISAELRDLRRIDHGRNVQGLHFDAHGTTSTVRDLRKQASSANRDHTSGVLSSCDFKVKFCDTAVSALGAPFTVGTFDDRDGLSQTKCGDKRRRNSNVELHRFLRSPDRGHTKGVTGPLGPVFQKREALVRLDEFRLQGLHRSFRSAVDLKGLQDVADVVLHRLFGDTQAAGDFLVAKPLCDEI